MRVGLHILIFCCVFLHHGKTDRGRVASACPPISDSWTDFAATLCIRGCGTQPGVKQGYTFAGWTPLTQWTGGASQAHSKFPFAQDNNGVVVQPVQATLQGYRHVLFWLRPALGRNSFFLHLACAGGAVEGGHVARTFAAAETIAQAQEQGSRTAGTSSRPGQQEHHQGGWQRKEPDTDDYKPFADFAHTAQASCCCSSGGLLTSRGKPAATFGLNGCSPEESGHLASRGQGIVGCPGQHRAPCGCQDAPQICGPKDGRRTWTGGCPKSSCPLCSRVGHIPIGARRSPTTADGGETDGDGRVPTDRGPLAITAGHSNQVIGSGLRCHDRDSGPRGRWCRAPRTGHGYRCGRRGCNKASDSRSTDRQGGWTAGVAQEGQPFGRQRDPGVEGQRKDPPQVPGAGAKGAPSVGSPRCPSGCGEPKFSADVRHSVCVEQDYVSKWLAQAIGLCRQHEVRMEALGLRRTPFHFADPRCQEESPSGTLFDLRPIARHVPKLWPRRDPEVFGGTAGSVCLGHDTTAVGSPLEASADERRCHNLDCCHVHSSETRRPCLKLRQPSLRRKVSFALGFGSGSLPASRPWVLQALQVITPFRGLVEPLLSPFVETRLPPLPLCESERLHFQNMCIPAEVGSDIEIGPLSSLAVCSSDPLAVSLTLKPANAFPEAARASPTQLDSLSVATRPSITHCAGSADAVSLTAPQAPRAILQQAIKSGCHEKYAVFDTVDHVRLRVFREGWSHDELLRDTVSSSRDKPVRAARLLSPGFSYLPPLQTVQGGSLSTLADGFPDAEAGLLPRIIPAALGRESILDLQAHAALATVFPAWLSTPCETEGELAVFDPIRQMTSFAYTRKQSLGEVLSTVVERAPFAIASLRFISPLPSFPSLQIVLTPSGLPADMYALPIDGRPAFPSVCTVNVAAGASPCEVLAAIDGSCRWSCPVRFGLHKGVLTLHDHQGAFAVKLRTILHSCTPSSCGPCLRPPLTFRLLSPVPQVQAHIAMHVWACQRRAGSPRRRADVESPLASPKLMNRASCSWLIASRSPSRAWQPGLFRGCLTSFSQVINLRHSTLKFRHSAA